MPPPVKRVRTALFGLGAVGLDCLRLAAVNPGLEVVGAVDDMPERVGRPVAGLTGMGQLDGLTVVPDLETLFRDSPPELILHVGGPRVLEELPRLRPALEMGVSVISQCAELVYPQIKAPQLAREIDALCRHTGARLFATGINPGFVMDVLPVCLSNCCRELHAVRVERVVGVSADDSGLLDQIGVGETLEEVAERLRQGWVGHAGLTESVGLIAHALGWKLDRTVLEGEPIAASAEFRLGQRIVSIGRASGIRQRATGLRNGKVLIELDLIQQAGAAEARDILRMEGEPRVEVRVPGGLNEGQSIPAAMINAAPRLLRAAPGLHLGTELALPHWSGNAEDAAHFFRI